jgi:hypothetical protein
VPQSFPNPSVGAGRLNQPVHAVDGFAKTMALEISCKQHRLNGVK